METLQSTDFRQKKAGSRLIAVAIRIETPTGTRNKRKRCLKGELGLSRQPCANVAATMNNNVGKGVY